MAINKLLNLAIEIDEGKITSNNLKDILIRESIIFEEAENENIIHIRILNKIIPLNVKNVMTKSIWNAIDDCIEKRMC